MEVGEKLSPEQILACLETSDNVRFQAKDKGELYDCVERTIGQDDRFQPGADNVPLAPASDAVGNRPFIWFA